MKKSTHVVEVIELNPEKHPNADSLSIQKIHDYQVVLKTDDWKDKKLAAYILPDQVVDTKRPEFAWLAPVKTYIDETGTDVQIGNKAFREGGAEDQEQDRYHRVTGMKLRGVLSFGLLVPAPEGSQPGDDVSDILGVTRYESGPLPKGATEPPSGYIKDYDLEAHERYGREVFQPGERVIVTEKMDGVNARYTFRDGRMHVGSRTIWLEEREGSVWWDVLKNNLGLRRLCEANPGMMVFGEIAGYQGIKTKLRYGFKEGQRDFFGFDILQGTSYLSAQHANDLFQQYSIRTVPVVAVTEYDSDKMKELAEGRSLLGDHIREGIVIRPTEERQNILTRPVLKLVSSKYLLGG